MFRSYKPRPMTKGLLAVEIKEEFSTLKELKVDKEGKGTYEYTSKASAQGMQIRVEFESTTRPELGDFIIQASKTDVYLCNAEEFNKKYMPTGSVL